MSGAARELVVRGLAALRRSGTWWTVGVLAFGVITVAFWPSFEGSEALQTMEEMSEGMLEAFGAQNIATPAGYLDGQMYALMLPLLLSGMAIAMVTLLTAGDEDAGRLELVHALPVRRSTVWLARLAAALVVLAAVTGLTAALMIALRSPFSLDEIGPGRLAVATAACGLLAAFHGCVGFAVGATGRPRGLAVGVSVLVLVVGYVLDFLFPLSDALAGGQSWSPWYWAIGSQPVSDGVSLVRLALLVAVSAALVVGGVVALNRRDLRTP